MSTAILRSLTGKLFSAGGHYGHKLALNILEIFHAGVHRSTFDSADRIGFANVYEKQHPPDLCNLILKQSLQFRHGQTCTLQILRVGIIGDDECVLSVSDAVPGDEDDHRILFRGASLQEILEPIAN